MFTEFEFYCVFFFFIEPYGTFVYLLTVQTEFLQIHKKKLFAFIANENKKEKYETSDRNRKLSVDHNMRMFILREFMRYLRYKYA